jgi:hypothetical protein
MQSFISKPVPSPAVPVITVRDFLNGLFQYLRTLTVFEFDRMDIECHREDKQTSISLYGQPQNIYVTIWDKAVGSMDSKLSNYPFEIRLSIPSDKIWIAARVTPQIDRAIAVDVIKTWNGTPGF